MKTWIIPLAVLMVVPALGAAAPIVQPPEPETLVEGHTVFTVIEQINQRVVNRVEYGAAVAVLVREVQVDAVRFRFPGVLWFNDQYLVNPNNVDNTVQNFRFPCTGAVLAVNSGAGDPAAAFTAGTPVYNESYLITDPNDHTWQVDKWNDATLGSIWVVPILNNENTMHIADDGTSSCAPVDEGEDLQLPVCPAGDKKDSKMALQPIRCRDESYVTPAEGGNAVSYNALLYFVLDDLTVNGGVKDHNAGSADSTNDVSGCDNSDASFEGTDGPTPLRPYDSDTTPDGNVHYQLTGRDQNTSTTNRGGFDCPDGDDGREGNSHPYNPFSGGLICPNCAGQGNHGGSGGGDNLHATRNIDIYYGVAPKPASRNVVLTDTEGSTAPFHCHGATLGCSDIGYGSQAPYGGRGY